MNIVWLTEISKESIAVAGGKGANLAEMFNMKLPVPPAFVVTAEAYQKFIEQAGLREKISNILSSIDIENTAQLEEKAKEIQMLIVGAKMPADLEKEILEAYDALSMEKEKLIEARKDVLAILKAAKEPCFVAVRSSATTEDLATASFAGQQETYLNIKGNAALLEAVKKCFASLFTARAIYYRTRKGFEHANAFLAVIVQRMINSDSSGVIFTVDPRTNDRSKIIIEAVFGLGEGIVSGAIAPDSYIIDKKNIEIIERRVSLKPIYFTRNAEGKTIKANLHPSKASMQVLSNSEIKQLANYSLGLEEHYKKPQDVEWAIERGSIYIVQTRPITTLEKEINPVKIEETPLVSGIGASPGITSGIVKILYSLDDMKKIQKGDILVTKMTNPDMVVTMQKANAIVTDEGGATCHAAIVSREVGLPCIVGTRNATKILKDGMLVTVNAYDGKVYSGKIEVTKPVEAKELKVEAPLAPIETKIYMNLGEPEKIQLYKTLNFDGIGLMRLEFVIASQIKEHPLAVIEKGQQEKYINALAEGISLVAKTISPKPVVVRFSDFKSNEYKGLQGGEKFEQNEANPMIGFRGVSRYISKEFSEAFRLECRAIKKVRQQYKNVFVMLPFVRTIDEVKKCLTIMKEEGLEREKEGIEIWLMAEVPSIALIPEEFAKLDIDAVSIGSNDLTQLVLGVDRDSALLSSLGYFDERNPAVLEAIKKIIEGFHKEGKKVSICGQAPSVYAEIVSFLVKNRIDSISVNPDAVEKTRAFVSEAELELLKEEKKEVEEMEEKELEKAWEDLKKKKEAPGEYYGNIEDIYY